MRYNHIGIKQFSPDDIHRFLGRFELAKCTRSTRQNHRRALFHYLEWLHEQGLLPWDPDPYRLHPKKLPAHGEDFLADLTTTLEPSSCTNYRSSLRKLARWLHSVDLEITTLTRPQVCLWLKHLAEQDLHAATRRTIIVNIRSFFHWLAERTLLEADPDDLLRSSDLPKLPKYLPRPLPVDIDVELQRRLAASSNPSHLALLLMRQTGLRIGELIRLEYQCVHADPAGHRALKVPLGKLKTERLVPITDEINELIQRLQRKRRRPRRWLLHRTKRHEAVYAELAAALRTVSTGLEDSVPITSHRLRHTYATSLLAGGMSLLGIMKLLGHRDERMTLRYTAITLTDVRREYHQAIDRIRTRYSLIEPDAPPSTSSEQRPTTLIRKVIRWLQSHASGHPKTAALLKRLDRAQTALRRIEHNLKSEEK